MIEIPADLPGLLGPNEKIELYIEQKIYYPTTSVDSVILTNERIILRHPHNLGLKTDFTDFPYSDIANVTLEQGVLRSTVICLLRSRGEPLRLSDILNADAQRAYGIIRRNLVQSQTPAPSSYSSGTTGSTMSLLQQRGTLSFPFLQNQPTVKEIVREVVLITCPHCGSRSAQGTVKCMTCGADL